MSSREGEKEKKRRKTLVTVRCSYLHLFNNRKRDKKKEEEEEEEKMPVYIRQ